MKTLAETKRNLLRFYEAVDAPYLTIKEHNENVDYCLEQLGPLPFEYRDALMLATERPNPHTFIRSVSYMEKCRGKGLDGMLRYLYGRPEFMDRLYADNPKFGLGV